MVRLALILVAVCAAAACDQDQVSRNGSRENPRRLAADAAAAPARIDQNERCAKSGREWFDWKRAMVDTDAYYMSKQVQFAHYPVRDTCVAYFAMVSGGRKAELIVADVLRNQSLLLWTEGLGRGVDSEKNGMIKSREEFDARLREFGFQP